MPHRKAFLYDRSISKYCCRLYFRPKVARRLHSSVLFAREECLIIAFLSHEFYFLSYLLCLVSWPDPSTAALVKGRSPARGDRPFTSAAEDGSGCETTPLPMAQFLSRFLSAAPSACTRSEDEPCTLCIASIY